MPTFRRNILSLSSGLKTGTKTDSAKQVDAMDEYKFKKNTTEYKLQDEHKRKIKGTPESAEEVGTGIKMTNL
jgi:predicted porin